MKTKMIALGLFAFLCGGLSLSAFGQASPFFFRADYATEAWDTHAIFGGSPGPVATGDFNGDHIPDLAVANNLSNDISILLGNGDGTFQRPAAPERVLLPTAGANWMIAADFNGDGHLDLAVASAGSVSILLGNGDGTFQAARTIATFELATAFGRNTFASGDFNGDGRPDLVVVVELSSGVSKANATVLLNNGDGTFTSRFAFDVPPNEDVSSVVVADFDGDGRQDLAVCTYSITYDADTSVYVALGRGDGTFGAPTATGLGAEPDFLAVGDFNNDGKPDLVADQALSGNTAILLGNGDGTFKHAPIIVPSGYTPGTIAVGDFNGDGHVDLALSNAFLWGKGDGTFEAPLNIDVPDIFQVITADVNGDGKPDLITLGRDNSAVSILVNATSAKRWPFTVASAASGITAVAPDSIASAYGVGLSNSRFSATLLPLPMSLGGVSVQVRDSAGTTRAAPLFYVSPTQINFLVPAGTSSGQATIDVNDSGADVIGSAFIQNVSPAVFVLQDTSCPAALTTTVGPDGKAQTPLPVARWTNQSCTSVPIHIPEGSHVYLSVFATGIRNSLTPVKCLINETIVPVLYAGAQGVFAGLDQVNVELTKDLITSSSTSILLNVDGRVTNPVYIDLE